MQSFSEHEQGFVLVEVILATSLFIIFVTALVGAVLYGQEAAMIAGNRMRATFLAEEGIEAVRSLRDGDFANIPAGTYGLAISGGRWTLSGSSDMNGIFTRQVVIADSDATRKSITVTVTWDQTATRSGSISATTRLTEWPFEPPPPPPPPSP